MDKKTEDNLKKIAKELSEKTEKAADMARDKITSQMENENVKNATQAAAKAAKESKEKITKHSKSFAQDVRELKDGAKTEKNYKTAFKMVLLMCAVALTALFIHEMIGFDMVFECCAFISLILLIYKAVKKKPKKNAGIAFVVFLALSGVFGLMTGSGRVPDNVLDYMGTKDRAVYKAYDKSDFYDNGYGTLANETNNHSGLPHIILYNGKVRGITLDSGMHASLNVGGLHIGDSYNQAETCMAKQKADRVPGFPMKYNLRYKGNDLNIIIYLDNLDTNGIVTRIAIVNPVS